MPLWDEYKNSIWMLPGYIQGIIRAGGLPIILPLSDDEEVFAQALEMCDGFLLTGGQDVSPALYGEEKRYNFITTYPLRDKLETLVLDRAIELDKPLLGICRGLQFMNAALGGTLYQDIPSDYHSTLSHLNPPPENPASHEVTLEPDTPLAYLLQEHTITVNSYHHQGIKQLSPILKCMARASDGLAEAADLPLKKFIWGIQWHPEIPDKPNNNNEKIFETFVTYAKLCKNEY